MTYRIGPVPGKRPGDPTSSSKAVVQAGISVPVGKHARPAKKIFNDRWLSIKILEGLGKADPATLNTKQS